MSLAPPARPAKRREASVDLSPAPETKLKIVPQERTPRVSPRARYARSIGDAASYSVMVGIGETYFAAFALAIGTGETFAGLIATLPMLAGRVAATGDALGPAPLAVVSHVGRALRQPASCGAACDADRRLVHRHGGGDLGLHRGDRLLGRQPGDRPGLEHLDRRDHSQPRAGELFRLPGADQPDVYAARLRGRRDRAAFGQGSGLGHGRVRRHFSGRLGLPVSLGLVSQHADTSPRAANTKRGSVSLGEAIFRTSGDVGMPLVLYLLAVQTAVQISGPYFTPFMLVKQDMSYFSFMVLIGIGFLGKVIALPMWGRVAQGRRRSPAAVDRRHVDRAGGRTVDLCRSVSALAHHARSEPGIHDAGDSRLRQADLHRHRAAHFRPGLGRV